MRVSLLFPSLLIATLSPGQSTIVFHGDKYRFSHTDTVITYDPISGNEDTTLLPPRIIRRNNDSVYELHGLSKHPALPGTGKKLSGYLFETLQGELARLPDGKYIISVDNPVVGREGRLVYYRSAGIMQMIPHKAGKTVTSSGTAYIRVAYTTTDNEIPANLKNIINQKVRQLLEQLPAITPGYLGATPVDATGAVFSKGNYIIVKDHAATFTPFYMDL